MLFNLYTNDQPIIKETKHFLYADDLALAAQDTTFEIVERKLIRSLQELANYYTKNQIKHRYAASTLETARQKEN